MQKWFPISNFLKNPLRIAVLLALFIFVLHLLTISFIKSKVFDEIYYASLGKSYVDQTLAFDVHPPLGKEIIGLGILIFGNNHFGWRFFSAFFGALLILLVFYLGRTVFKDKLLGLMAALLVATETLFFVLGQLALLEIFATVFLLLATFSLLKYSENQKNLWLLLFTLSLSAAFSTKWTVLIPGFVLLGFLFFELRKRKRLSLFILSVVSLMGFYLLTFEPHFQRREDVFFWHQDVLKYHLTTDKTHDYTSSPFLWPLDYKWVWFYFNRSSDYIQSVLLIGNPLNFLLQIIAFVWVIKNKLWKKKNLKILITLSAVGFLQWLVVVDKGFLYNWAPTLPFNFLLLAYFLRENLKPKTLLLIFTFSILIFFLLLPLMVGWKVPEEYWPLPLLLSIT